MSTAIAATVTVSTAAESTTATLTTAATASAGLGRINLDLLSEDGRTIHALSGSHSSFLISIGDEGVALASVVGVNNISKLLKSNLDFLIGCSSGDSVDEKTTSILGVSHSG